MRLTSFLLALSLVLGSFVPRRAQAMDRDLRSILVGGGYGLLGGTALGLASYPLTRDTRSIWIGSSVGLYLGLVIGIYNAISREDPGNPLHVEADKPKESGLQSEMEKFSPGPPPNAEQELNLGPSATRPDLADAKPSALTTDQRLVPPAWFELKVPLAHF